jgi:hypothetical protein
MSKVTGEMLGDVAQNVVGPRAAVAGYGKSLSRLAEFTRWITAPWILLAIASIIGVQILTGTEPFHPLDRTGLEHAGHFGGLVTTASLLDGTNHLVFFVTWVAVFIAILRVWPVRAALVLVLGAISLAFGLAKGITTSYLATTLGAAYLANPTEQTSLLAAGKVADGLRAGLQDMDTYPLVAIWVLLSLLPASAGLGRAARIMGWILASALILGGLLQLIGVDNPLFLVVVLISPPYFFLLGSWLKRISRGAVVPDPARSQSASA